MLNLYDNSQPDFQPLGDAIDEQLDKRTIGSLARNGLLSNGKRNIGSMARMGMLRTSVGGNEYTNKRSIATLAKNGQLPSREPETDDSSSGHQWMNEKRNIGALARSGLMANGKRNIGSLARSYDLPAYGKRNLASIVRSSPRPGSSSKRNIASLARSNMRPFYGGGGNEYIKRNVGALARDWSLPTPSNRVNAKREATIEYCKFDLFALKVIFFFLNKTFLIDKRNIGSLKNSPVHGTKTKREASIYDDYVSAEQLKPVYQPAPIDYEELNQVMSHLYPYYDMSALDGDSDDSEKIHEEKRYLGKCNFDIIFFC